MFYSSLWSLGGRPWCSIMCAAPGVGSCVHLPRIRRALQVRCSFRSKCNCSLHPYLCSCACHLRWRSAYV
jgi:hypothetical protein